MKKIIFFGFIIGVILALVVIQFVFACEIKEPEREVCLDETASNYQEEFPCQYVEVTPTPTEELKGNPSDERFAESSTNAPSPVVCTVYHVPAKVWYEGEQFKWATDEKGIQKFSIVYGSSPDQLIYGIDNIPSDSRGIGINRPAWKQTWFQVWTWIDGCAVQSEIVDP